MFSRYSILVLAFVAFTSTAQAQPRELPPAPAFSIMQAVTLTAYVSDATTSTYIFGQRKGHEAGLGPTHSPLVFGIIKGGSAAGVLWATNRLRRAGRGKLAMVLMITASSVEFSMAARNARMIRR